MHKPLTVSEMQRLAELVEAGTPIAEICEGIGRDRGTIRRNINSLARRPRPERKWVTAAVEPGRARGDLSWRRCW